MWHLPKAYLQKTFGYDKTWSSNTHILLLQGTPTAIYEKAD